MGAASIEFENWQRKNRLGRFALPMSERTRKLKTEAILSEIEKARTEQIKKGYSPKHDDWHSNKDLIDFASGRIERHDSNTIPREDVIKAAAILVALVEKIDRENTD